MFVLHFMFYRFKLKTKKTDYTQNLEEINNSRFTHGSDMNEAQSFVIARTMISTDISDALRRMLGVREKILYLTAKESKITFLFVLFFAVLSFLLVEIALEISK